MANIYLTLPVLPILNNSMSFDFPYIIGIDFRYDPLLYHNHSAWIEYFLPIIQLLISSFHLKCIFLFNHLNPDNLCTFVVLMHVVQSLISSLNHSTRLILPTILVIMLVVSVPYFYSHHFHLNHLQYLRNIFHHSFLIRYISYRLLSKRLVFVFNTNYIINALPISTTPNLFHHLRCKGFVQ